MWAHLIKTACKTVTHIRIFVRHCVNNDHTDNSCYFNLKKTLFKRVMTSTLLNHIMYTHDLALI